MKSLKNSLNLLIIVGSLVVSFGAQAQVVPTPARTCEIARSADPADHSTYSRAFMRMKPEYPQGGVYNILVAITDTNGHVRQPELFGALSTAPGHPYVGQLLSATNPNEASTINLLCPGANYVLYNGYAPAASLCLGRCH